MYVDSSRPHRLVPSNSVQFTYILFRFIYNFTGLGWMSSSFLDARRTDAPLYPSAPLRVTTLCLLGACTQHALFRATPTTPKKSRKGANNARDGGSLLCGLLYLRCPPASEPYFGGGLPNTARTSRTDTPSRPVSTAHRNAIS